MRADCDACLQGQLACLVLARRPVFAVGESAKGTTTADSAERVVKSAFGDL